VTLLSSYEEEGMEGIGGSNINWEKGQDEGKWDYNMVELNNQQP
jgi:hypothetical protein